MRLLLFALVLCVPTFAFAAEKAPQKKVVKSIPKKRAVASADLCPNYQDLLKEWAGYVFDRDYKKAQKRIDSVQDCMHNSPNMDLEQFKQFVTLVGYALPYDYSTDLVELIQNYTETDSNYLTAYLNTIGQLSFCRKKYIVSIYKNMDCDPKTMTCKTDEYSDCSGHQ